MNAWLIIVVNVATDYFALLPALNEVGGSESLNNLEPLSSVVDQVYQAKSLTSRFLWLFFHFLIFTFMSNN